ncbi:hypothetical protein [Klenkia marina]|nr:hypothetical protein [Klenkia marina]
MPFFDLPASLSATAVPALVAADDRFFAELSRAGSAGAAGLPRACGR